jgi:hypothetical protein
MSSINPKHHAGAEWLIRNGKANPSIENISDLGIRVADFLGYLYAGIYHISSQVLHKRVDWSNKHWIEVTVSHHAMATFDYSYLTKAVLLAHHFCLRLAIEGAAPKYIRLVFHPRTREGDIGHSHPTLDEAVTKFKESFDFLEVTTEKDPWTAPEEEMEPV